MEVEEIYSLKKQMLDLGYVEGEVNAFIHDVTGDQAIEKLNKQEYHELIEYLSSYISFARKSKQLVANCK
ncbi:hypothetical protein SPSIL_055410 [Sporomusa silvacetica DSM 10669]|uniref:Uncharacterized protein n=1 Tax=Sporomusa silvacetica DSM 10669 TaxID=1123289 RepID=A0ABZ3IUB4_9FIRM|nr:hypothetical protein [Sporomusa silvacetica]OZC21183.1 hypothetical protein SPSIL_12230 [Sporomusa silvacetica DSM 10669]